MRTPFDPPFDAFADRIEKERTAEGWTIGDLCNRAGISRSTYIRIREAESLTQFGTVIKLADAFGIDRDEFVRLSKGGTVEPPKEGTLANALRVRLPNADPIALAEFAEAAAKVFEEMAFELRGQSDGE